MNNDISAFDSFIESPKHSQVITILLTLLARSKSKDNVVVYGDRAAVTELVTKIAYHFPQENILIGLVSQHGATVTFGPPFPQSPIVLETEINTADAPRPFIHGGQITNAIRMLLHVNPDAIALTEIDDESKEILLMEASARRQIIVGLEADTLDQALGKMVDSRSVLEGHKLPFHVAVAVEVRTSGKAKRIIRVYCCHDGSLREMVVVDSAGNNVIDPSLLPVSQ